MFSHSDIVELNSCLACDSETLIPVLDLNDQPLANSYKHYKTDNESYFPLAINRCNKCYHVQLTHAINPDLMFKNYSYVSGTSNTMHDHFKWFANYTCEYFSVLSAMKASTVLDIGCNDGTQLNYFKELKIITHGVDPAVNLHKLSSKNHQIYPYYFNMKFIEDNHNYYDIIVAQNVFAHNYNPKGFLTAARHLMTNDSLLFIQTSQSDMILNGEFDTIYHEHISFYNIRSMRHLCERSGLYLIDVIKCPLHGNSYIFIISKNKLLKRSFNIMNLEQMENNIGLYSMKKYGDYKIRAKSIAQELKNVILYYRHEKNMKVVGYGAAAKGMTLLNYAKLTNQEFDYIIDDNPLKHNMYTPGSNIEICSSNKLNLENKSIPILFVPLAWNFYDEIRAKIKNIRENSPDLYVKYFPEVMVHTNAAGFELANI